MSKTKHSLQESRAPVSLAVEKYVELYAAPARPGLLKLPNELLNMIWKDLPHYNKFSLSQTCRSLRERVPISWTRLLSGNLWTPKDRGDFLFRFTNDMSIALRGKYICPSCGKLHPVNYSDIPSAGLNERPCRAAPSARMAGPLNRAYTTNASSREYRIRDRHVQVALRLHRFIDTNGRLRNGVRNSLQGNPITNQDKQYLRDVMAYQDYTARCDDSVGVVTFSAEPRFSQDRHFLLRVTWRYQTVGFGDGLRELTGVRLCPHLRVAEATNSNNHNVTEFERKLLQARHGRSQRLPARGGCAYCLLDYEIRGSFQHFNLTVWRDFGAERSAMDEAWKRCRLPVEGMWGAGPSTAPEVSILDRKHGTVMDAYQSAIRQAQY